MALKDRDQKSYHRWVVRSAHENGMRPTAERAERAPSTVVYRMQKAIDPTFHSAGHGGARYHRFDVLERIAIDRILLWLAREKPLASMRDRREFLQREGFTAITDTYIRRCHRRLNLTWKKASVKAAAKYSLETSAWWAQHVTAMWNMDPLRVKFADEVDFQPRKLWGRNLIGLSEAGRAVHVLRSDLPRYSSKEKYTLMLLTNLQRDMGEHPPFYLADPFRNNCNSGDFIAFVIECLREGQLVQGDFFVVDNAPIHKSEQALAALDVLLAAAGVRLVFLPPYASDLNPCEYVFAVAKGYVRRNPSDDDTSFAAAVGTGFLQLNHRKMARIYHHCMRPPHLRQPVHDEDD